MKLPSLQSPPEMIEILCLKKVKDKGGKEVAITEPISFEFDGVIQKWAPGKSEKIPVWAWEILQRRGYICLVEASSVKPEQEPVQQGQGQQGQGQKPNA